MMRADGIELHLQPKEHRYWNLDAGNGCRSGLTQTTLNCGAD